MADKDVQIGGILHVCEAHAAPPVGDARVSQRIVYLVVQGAPRRARVTLSQGGKVLHTGNTDDNGAGMISGVAPGAYSCVWQRAGKPARRAQTVMIAGTKPTIVLGAAG